MTSDKINGGEAALNEKISLSSITKVLLIKGIPLSSEVKDLLGPAKQFGHIQDSLFIWDQQMAFIQFKTIQEAFKCYKNYHLQPLKLKGKEIQICMSSRNSLSHMKERVESIPHKIIVVTFESLRFKITKQLIRKYFGQFGKIIEILIFKRRYRMCFIQYGNIQSASKAFQTFNKKVIPNMCYVRIKFSNIQKIILKKPKRKNTISGYEIRPTSKSSFNSYQSCSSQKKQLNNQLSFSPQRSFRQNSFNLKRQINQSHNKFQDQRKDQQLHKLIPRKINFNNYEQNSNQSKNNDQFHTKNQGKVSSKLQIQRSKSYQIGVSSDNNQFVLQSPVRKNTNFDFLKEEDEDLEQERDSTFSKPSTSLANQNKSYQMILQVISDSESQQTESSIEKTKIQRTLIQTIQTNQTSKVIKIIDCFMKDISLQQIYNIFSLYGPIVQIKRMIFSQNQYLINYLNQNDAINCYQNLNNNSLFQLKYSEVQNLSIPLQTLKNEPKRIYNNLTIGNSFLYACKVLDHHQNSIFSKPSKILKLFPINSKFQKWIKDYKSNQILFKLLDNCKVLKQESSQVILQTSSIKKAYQIISFINTCKNKNNKILRVAF